MQLELDSILNLHSIVEAVDRGTIEKAMDDNKRVILRYTGEDGIPTVRQVELFALGLSTANNEVVRAFQLNHKPSAHATVSGEWKLFRLDRIDSIKSTNYNVRYMYPYVKKQLRNKDGDRTMAQVYKVAAPGYEAFTGELERAQTVDTNVTPGPIRQPSAPIGTYTTKKGEKLNIVGFKSRGDGKHIIAVTDKGGHLFFNPNQLSKDPGADDMLKKLAPNNPKDWLDSLSRSIDDTFKDDVANKAKADIDSTKKEDTEEGPIKTSENGFDDEYNTNKEEV